MIFGYGLCSSSRRQAVMVLSSKGRLTRLRAKHDAVSHFWVTNKKLKLGFMLKNACVNNAVCPGIKIALPTNRGRSHFLFAFVLSVYGPFIEVSGMTGATFTVFVTSFCSSPFPISSCPPYLRRVPLY